MSKLLSLSSSSLSLKWCFPSLGVGEIFSYPGVKRSFGIAFDFLVGEFIENHRQHVGLHVVTL